MTFSADAFSHRRATGIPADRLVIEFDITSLYSLRATVAAHGAALGLDVSQQGAILVVVTELATNAIRHGGGRGILRLWRAGETVLCEVSDAGPGIGPNNGAELPPIHEEGGRGLWIIRQLAQTVELRNGDRGTQVTVSFAV